MKASKKMEGAAFVIAAVIAVFTALSHLSCIYLGASCYKAQMAPPEIVESAINGTLLAPVGTAFIASLFLLCAAYALSRAGLIRKLPLLNLGVVTIGVLCLVRGLSTVPLSMVYPEMVSTFSMVAGIVWFLTGVLFLLGHRWVARELPGEGEVCTPA